MQLTDIEVTDNWSVYSVESFEVQVNFVKFTPRTDSTPCETELSWRVIPNSINIMLDDDSEQWAPFLSDSIAIQASQYIEDSIVNRYLSI